MATTNHERVGRALDLLRAGLAPYIEREFENRYHDRADAEARRLMSEDRLLAGKPIGVWEAAALIKLMGQAWSTIFANTLGNAERNLVSEIRDFRNKWAHQEPFSSDDADRALDSMARLLTAVSAPEANEVNKIKQELRRLVFDELARSERRRGTGTLVEGTLIAGLTPWRDVIRPHDDVSSGRYQQAEFAADLWQVHVGEGTPEYRDPVEFFKRTYLTASLQQLLVGAIRRLTGTGGDPVVQLQTNFGGGKTHSMLALYHLVAGQKPSELTGIEAMLTEADLKGLPKARRVVLVGNKISPGNPVTKADGTIVRTLWGELAWQLGGKEAFARIAADDERATNPGDVLRTLFNDYGPCLILIDEWVAYARQLHDQADLPAGGFETQFTFAQALTESAKLAKNCLLVISLPASDSGGSTYSQTDDVEVGGVRGREALDRLRNVIGRIESSWRPATAEEGFEIVRRRLFQPLEDPARYTLRDNTARAFGDLYRNNKTEFPSECTDADYEKRIIAAYPIHPEIFDRLYTDWSTLVKFQRTRGVLRLMAAVIHSLWHNDDRNALIMPATLPLDDQRVQNELTRYLSDVWVPIIEKDVDGPSSLPRKIDAEVSNLGKLQATRRVARTIYLGSAPGSTAAHRGLEDRRVKLGCVLPGESPHIFGDALRRLAASATYLYQDGPRVWYSTQPTVTKLADDRAELLRRNRDRVIEEIEQRLRTELKNKDDFRHVHDLPHSGADVSDDLETRLVVLGVDHPYVKGTDCPALQLANQILESRGSQGRQYRNALVFLAPDKARLQDLEDAARRYLAWESILNEKTDLNLDPQQETQARNQAKSAENTLKARLPETYNWLLVPTQADPRAKVEWQPLRLQGSDSLAARAMKRLRNEDLLAATLGATMLRKALDEVPLWGGNHVAIRKLPEYFASYLYLQRLAGPEVLVRAIQDGLTLPSWEAETFAFAESFDEEAGRYASLRCGSGGTVAATSPSLLVRPSAARAQMDADAAIVQPVIDDLQPDNDKDRVTPPPVVGPTPGPKPPVKRLPQRFHATFEFGDSERVGRDAGKVAEEVIAHLASLVGADVRITLEIEATVPSGVEDKVVRIVNENCKTLKFKDFGFEVD